MTSFYLIQMDPNICRIFGKFPDLLIQVAISLKSVIIRFNSVAVVNMIPRSFFSGLALLQT